MDKFAWRREHLRVNWGRITKMCENVEARLNLAAERGLVVPNLVCDVKDQNPILVFHKLNHQKEWLERPQAV